VSHFFQVPFSVTIESLSTSGAFENVMFRNSGSVFQPLPSSRVPVAFLKWLSWAFILDSFVANSFRSFFESLCICCFSFSVTLW